jgi:hypothetical protein
LPDRLDHAGFVVGKLQAPASPDPKLVMRGAPPQALRDQAARRIDRKHRDLIAENRPPASTAGCSTAETNSRDTRTGERPIRKSGVRTWLAASVAPEQKTHLCGGNIAEPGHGLARTRITARALRPSACTEDGLPGRSIASIIADRAAVRSGAVAL